MRRFFLAHADFSKSPITLIDQSEIHHIKNVLRFKTGDEVCLFNDLGQEAIAVIEQISQSFVELSIKEIKIRGERITPRVILACALPKKSKFEWIIEKCTELGVAEIYPLQTKRTEVILRAEKMVSKLKRFDAVALNAAKQSQRNVRPVIHPGVLFQDLVKKEMSATLKIIPCLIQKRFSFYEALSNYPQAKNVCILIGPEGDFTSQEVEMAVTAGFVPVSLGETVLKVETAAIAAMSFINLFYTR